MISGTYILTDTIKSAFGTVFTAVYKHTDVVVTGKSALGGGERSGATADGAGVPRIAARAPCAALPGVADAQGVHLRRRPAGGTGRQGDLQRRRAGARRSACTPHGNQRFNPLQLVAGRWPSGPVRSRSTPTPPTRTHYAVGETIGVIARGAEQRYRIAGIAEDRRRLLARRRDDGDLRPPRRPAGSFTRWASSTRSRSPTGPATRPALLVREIRPLLPPNAQVRTGAGGSAEGDEQTNGFLAIIQDFLLAFAGIALFVGGFVIANTLSITIAQRTRELATLRTLGATRRQVLRSVLLEAFVIGLLASVVGLFLGLGLAQGPQLAVRVASASTCRRRAPSSRRARSSCRSPSAW